MRSISSDIGDIEAEILIPRKQKSNKIEMELMRLLSDLVLPTPEMIARKVEQSGNVISKQYLDLIEQMLTETTQLQRKGRKYKTKAHRAQRLATMSRVRKDPDSTAKKVISTGKNIINKIFG